MMDRPGRWPLSLDGHVQSLESDLGVQGLAHGPANDLARVHVQDRSEVQPAFARRHIGQVGEPDFVGGLGREAPAEPVGRDRIAMTAVSGPGPTWQGGQSAKARPPHQPLNAAASDAAAVAPKDGVHPRRAVGPAALGVDQPDVFQQRPVGRSPPALGPSSPRVVATGRQPQDLAHHPNRPDLAMLIDEPELHREAAPKMSAAFMEWPAPHLPAS